MQKKSSSQSAFLNRRVVIAVALFSIGASLGWLSFAASTSGTLTPTSGPVTYTHGPFVVPNDSAQVALMCTPAAAFPCDDFTLTVTVTDATKIIKVNAQWPVAAADFDLYVLQGTSVIAQSATSSDPEITFIPAVAGVYTVRMVPFAPAGQSYTVTISLQDIPPPPPPATGAVPRYQNYPAPASASGAASSGEPSIGVDWNIVCPPTTAGCENLRPNAQFPKRNTGGVAFFTANLNEYRASFDDCSSPAKNLWEDVTNLSESLASLDPIGFVDHETGRVFEGQLAGATSILSFSSDDGQTWTQSQGSGQPAGVDHPNVFGGPYNNNAVPPPPPHPLYQNAVYYASQDIATSFISRSDNGGLTFGPGVPMWNLTQCGGLHGFGKVGPDGTVYVPNGSCGSMPGVAVSIDNGLTWTVRTVTNATSNGADPGVGIGSDNTLYVGYVDGSGIPHAATSTDKGVTWIDRDISQGFIKNTVFPVAAAGDGTRAAVGFLGTPTGGNYQDTNNFKGVWGFYIATTFDRGQTWSLVNATGNDPVQVGSICTGGTTCGSDRNLLDFNDMVVDKEGRVVVGYADGCVAPGCTADTASGSPPYNASRSALGSIIRQSGGPRLFAAYDSQANCTGSPPACTPTAPAAPRVNSVAGSAGSTVSLNWSEPDNGGSALTGYRVYRRTNPGSYGAPLATITQGCPACKTTYDDTTTVAGTAYFYKVTALNSQGESTNCGEFPIGTLITETNCIIPGLTILTDQSGDIITPLGENTNPGWDLRKLSIAEPYVFAPAKLVFTIKVENLTVLPQNTRWPIQFRVPGDTATFLCTGTGTALCTLGRWVDMRSDPTQPTGVGFKYGTYTIPVATGTYGAPSTVVGDADVGSTYSPDGTITIVMSRSKIGSPLVSQNLTGFLMRVRFGTDVAAVTPDNMPDSLGPTGSYTIVGNDPFCRPNLAPIAALTASPLMGDAPLLVNFDASGSSDPDTAPPADTVASFTFDFGDGTAPVTQSSPLISHTYNSNGEFRATVSVTDSRGKPSDNVAGVNLTVELPLAKVESRKIHGTKGPFYVTLFDDAQPANPPEIECRTTGGNNAYTIIYTFDRTVTAPGTATKTQGTSDNPGTPTLGPLANQVTVELTGVTNVQHLIIRLDDVLDSAGAILNNVRAKLDVLVGDVNGNASVSNGDVSLVKAQVASPVVQGNFRADVNANGAVTNGDVSLTKAKVPSSLP